MCITIWLEIAQLRKDVLDNRPGDEGVEIDLRTAETANHERFFIDIIFRFVIMRVFNHDGIL